jgi:hypothetical protein
MPSRSPYWCVAEISKDGKVNPISPTFEHAPDAEERRTNYWQKKNTGARIFR